MSAEAPTEGTPLDPVSVIQQVVAAATEADGISPLDEDTLLALKHEALAVDDFRGDQRGFAWVRGSQLHLVVAPASRDRGLGAELLAAVSAEARTAWSHGDHAGARALAAAHGWEPTRELLMLRRPAPSGPEPEYVAPPSDVTIRTFQPGDEAQLLSVNEAAFSAHPEQGGLTADGLAARMAEPWFDPNGLFVAERDGAILGFHWTKVHLEGPDAERGEVYVMAVHPSAQGLGLGRRLLERGLTHLHPRDVILYVESDNEPAVALYFSIGFKNLRRDVQYSRT